MANPVWVLSVDLQTKTAVFTSGLADAAKSARGAFNEIKSGASEMGDSVSGSSTNVRAAIGLLDNTIRGAHGAAMADLIREFSNTALVMNALPFLPVVGGLLFMGGSVVELVKHFQALREEQEKLVQQQTQMGTTINEVWNGLDGKILAAEKRTDELRNDHFGALQKELELIDHQSMDELVKSLETIAKAADDVFSHLNGGWLEISNPGKDAARQLDEITTRYKALIAAGKDGDAASYLKNMRDEHEKILNAQWAMQGSRQGGGLLGPSVDYESQYKALATLQQAGVGYSQQDAAAQLTLVDALNAQLGSMQRVNELKKLDSGNASRNTAGEMSRQASEAARQSIDSQLRMGELAIAADRAKADAQLQIGNASAAQRLTVETDFAGRMRDVQLTANQEQIAALDKLSKDYPNQLKVLQDKALEIQQQYTTTIAQATARASEESNAQAIRDLEESNREQIQATQQGSQARIAAIDAALKAEALMNLQSTDSYRALLTSRVEAMREMSQQELDIRLRAVQASTEISLREAALFNDDSSASKSKSDGINRKASEEQKALLRQYVIQQQGYDQQLQALQSFGNTELAKIQDINNKKAQLQAQYGEKSAEIERQRQQDINALTQQGERKYEQMFAEGFARVLMGHESFSEMMVSIGDRVGQSMLQQALMDLMSLDIGKEKQAAAAARAMFIAGTKFPFPENIVAAPAMAIAAFSQVMGFAEGGIVPGVAKGDIVPAMLTPGEGVIPNGVMDNLRRMAASGNMGGSGTHVHMHYRPTFHVNTIDGAGVRGVLQKHNKEFTQHFHNQMRRLNK